MQPELRQREAAVQSFEKVDQVVVRFCGYYLGQLQDAVAVVYLYI